VQAALVAAAAVEEEIALVWTIAIGEPGAWAPFGVAVHMVEDLRFEGVAVVDGDRLGGYAMAAVLRPRPTVAGGVTWRRKVGA